MSVQTMGSPIVTRGLHWRPDVMIVKVNHVSEQFSAQFVK